MIEKLNSVYRLCCVACTYTSYMITIFCEEILITFIYHCQIQYSHNFTIDVPNCSNKIAFVDNQKMFNFETKIQIPSRSGSYFNEMRMRFSNAWCDSYMWGLLPLLLLILMLLLSTLRILDANESCVLSNIHRQMRLGFVYGFLILLLSFTYHTLFWPSDRYSASWIVNQTSVLRL